MRGFPSLRVYDPGQKSMGGKSNMVYLNSVEQMDDAILFRFKRHLEDYDNLKYMWGTGLRDDAGEEIYDGDIVEVKNEMETKTSHISQVENTIYGARIDAHPSSIGMGLCKHRQLLEYCDYGVGGIYHLTCKIVGNIYENPELLEDENEG